MDSNTIAIVLASMSFVGTIVVALLSRQTAHQTEQLKYQLQREQTRFASIHSKQVDVLSRLFKLCIQAKANYDTTRLSWDTKNHINNYKDLENAKVLTQFLGHYVSLSKEATESLDVTNTELATFLNENLVFIDNPSLESHLLNFTSLLSLIPTHNRVLMYALESIERPTYHSSGNSLDFTRHQFETLERTHKQLSAMIPQILEDIKFNTRLSITGNDY